MSSKLGQTAASKPSKNSGDNEGARPRWIIGAIVYFCVLTGLGLAGGAFLKDASAANWTGPTASPPLGNIPLPVWNRLDTTQKQQNTAIDIEGYVNTGSINLDLGSTVGGQNLFYGFVPYDNMHQADPNVPGDKSDNLLLLETEKSNVWTNRFRVDRDGNVTAAGNLWASGCLGPVFVGTTSLRYKGDLTPGGTDRGYFAANAKCDGAISGSHVCSTAEMLNSIKCATVDSKIKDNGFGGTDAWMQDGPPGYTAPANDCQGWRSSVSTDLGRMWRFDSSRGGIGFLTTCNQTIVFACCK